MKFETEEVELMIDSGSDMLTVKKVVYEAHTDEFNELRKPTFRLLGYNRSKVDMKGVAKCEKIGIDMIVVFGDFENILGRNYMGKIKWLPNYDMNKIQTEESTIKDYEKESISNGILNKIENPRWGSPMCVALKADCSTSMNDSIEDYNTIIPPTKDFLSKIKANYFCSLDLSDAFNNVPIKEECRELTTIITKWGCFKYKRLLQGLKISPLFFQEYISKSINEDQKEFIIT
uniref:Reverse transcriptase domain-containing protein n=1 Tax=Strongyloides venezuelensis TaxID=75913 RepID=A0A0K0F066_STRVS